MKNKATRYSIPFATLLLLIFCLIVACAQPEPSLPPKPPETPPTQPPPATVENKPPVETPPVDKPKDGEQWYKVETFFGKENQNLPPFHIYGTKWRVTWTIDAEERQDAALDLLIHFDSASGDIWKVLPYTGGRNGTVTYLLESGGNRDFFIAVIARNLRQWTITVEDNATAAVSSPVQITYIHYKGKIYPTDPDKCCAPERVEPDEYVVIKNLSESPQEMGGWVLKNIDRGYPSFRFPLNFVLGPGQITRVYTNMIYPECEKWREFGSLPEDCAPFMNLWFTFNYGIGEIWSNEKPDVAVLYNSRGEEVSRKSYAVPVKNE
jgi:hypothetical protein